MPMTMSVVMYKRLGISNTDIALYTSWLYLPWVIKPLWGAISDFIPLVGYRRRPYLIIANVAAFLTTNQPADDLGADARLILGEAKRRLKTLAEIRAELEASDALAPPEAPTRLR